MAKKKERIFYYKYKVVSGSDILDPFRRIPQYRAYTDTDSGLVDVTASQLSTSAPPPPLLSIHTFYMPSCASILHYLDNLVSCLRKSCDQQNYRQSVHKNRLPSRQIKSEREPMSHKCNKCVYGVPIFTCAQSFHVNASRSGTKPELGQALASTNRHKVCGSK